MRKLTAQFRIEDELLTAIDGNKNQSEITESILQRLRNRTAIFDKLIEDDGDDDVEIQLHDHDNLDAEGPAATHVDITFTLEDDVLEILEKDPDLVFVKVLSALDGDKLKLTGDAVQNNIAFISFS